jgi:molybdenum-dependent DNA-binding transcriptional regulator ModE
MNGQKGVVQYDKDMNKIKEFKSIKEASNELNLSYFSIGKCCNGKQKLCGDFIFKFT